jgi:hypothetical protein
LLVLGLQRIAGNEDSEAKAKDPWPILRASNLFPAGMAKKVAAGMLFS